MAKKSKPQNPQAPHLPIMGMPAVNPFAQPFGWPTTPSATESRKIVKADQQTSVFHLDDGTKLTITPVLIDAKRVTNQWGANGKPMYLMTVTNITDTESPPRLMDPRLASTVKKSKAKKSAKR